MLSSEGNPHPDTNRKQCRRGVQLLCDENTNVSFLGRYQCRYLKQTSERVSSYTLDDLEDGDVTAQYDYQTHYTEDEDCCEACVIN